MTEWVVRRWARYGHERLYAETPGGTALGYLDLKTGRYHSDDPTNLPLLEKAIGDHLAEKQSVEVPALAIADPVETPADGVLAAPFAAEERPVEPTAQAWEDLGAHQAGVSLREQALLAREGTGKLRHFFNRLVDAKTDERAWRIGADGEEAVAVQLAKLGPEWRVIHSIEVGGRGSDIDHVLIGPGGVITVNSKNHPDASIWVGGDTFMVNGQRVPYVRNSRHEAKRASRLLTEQVGFSVTALGVIAVMGAQKGWTIKKQPEDGAVVIVQRRQISQYVAKLRPRLTDREIEAIYEAACRSTTWR